MSEASPVLLALCAEILADERLAALVSPDVVVEMAEVIADEDEVPITVLIPVPPPAVGALRRWQSMSDRERPSSGPLFRAACYEAQSRDYWRQGLHAAAYEAMTHAATIVSAIAGEVAA